MYIRPRCGRGWRSGSLRKRKRPGPSCLSPNSSTHPICVCVCVCVLHAYIRVTCIHIYIYRLERKREALPEGVVQERRFQHAAEENGLLLPARVCHDEAAPEAAGVGGHHALEDNVRVHQVKAQRLLGKRGRRRDGDVQAADARVILARDTILFVH